MNEIQLRVEEHLTEAINYFPFKRTVGIFLQGSQNYNLDLPTSDIDTKLIVTPSFNDIALNKSPVSTTHIRDNEEHIDFKDIRLYINTFRKQNLNFLEILFTKYFYMNRIYVYEWQKLVNAREAITHYNPIRSIKSMFGIAMEKYHAMEHQYPSKVEIFEKYSYDPKQLHHLVRVEEYLERYINGEPYADCLIAKNRDYLLSIKQGDFLLKDARIIAEQSIAHIRQMVDNYCNSYEETIDQDVEDLFQEVQCAIMRIAIKEELAAYECE